MSNEPKPPNPASPSDDARQPYEPPTIECEELFEVLALSCGKIQPNTFACVHVPKVS
jgi:hypothetical protein